MEDQNSNRVKEEDTCWTLGRIFEILNSDCPPVAIKAEELPRMITVLMSSIDDDPPDVSEKICRAICFLARRYKVDDAESSSLLTPYLDDITSALLDTADRMDDDTDRLEAAAYEALNEIVRCSSKFPPETSKTVIAPLLLEITHRLSTETAEPIDPQTVPYDLLARMCGILQAIVEKLNGHDETKSLVLDSADRMMDLLGQVFRLRSATAREASMLAMGSLAHAMGPAFAKHMPVFTEYLDFGLKNIKKPQVCSVSVGVVRDICLALGGTILIPFCDGIMACLVRDLSNPELDDSVKPSICSRLGDVALAIGGEHFEKYFAVVMNRLQQAADRCIKLDYSNEALLEKGKRLREGIFGAWSGIIQGFKGTSKEKLILSRAPFILDFAEAVFRNDFVVAVSRDERVTYAGAAVMGHLVDIVSPESKEMFQTYQELVDPKGNGLDPVTPDDPDFAFHDARWDEVNTWTMIGLLFVYVLKNALEL